MRNRRCTVANLDDFVSITTRLFRVTRTKLCLIAYARTAELALNVHFVVFICLLIMCTLTPSCLLVTAYDKIENRKALWSSIEVGNAGSLRPIFIQAQTSSETD